MSTSGLMRKLSLMDSALCSAADSYSIAWSIDDFPKVITQLRNYAHTETLPIHLPGIGETEWVLSCRFSSCDGWPKWPYNKEWGRGSVQLSIQLNNSQPSNKFLFSIGLLDRDGSEMCECKRQAGTVAYISQAWLRESAEVLLPGGTLHAHFKIFFTCMDKLVTRTKMTRQLQQLGQPTENLFSSMADNSSFVDLGPGSSVLLVFEDGEQRCHTFPLAARHGLVLLIKRSSIFALFRIGIQIYLLIPIRNRTL